MKLEGTLEVGTRVLVKRELAEIVGEETDGIVVRYTARGYSDRDITWVVPAADIKPIEVVKHDKCTLYIASEFGFGYKRVEARDVMIEKRPYAQHAEALHVTFTPKGARKERKFVNVAGNSKFYVLDGWGHPDLGKDLFIKAADGGQITRYASCDPRWDSDFKAALDAYQASKSEF